jgi:hypothetical protein
LLDFQRFRVDMKPFSETAYLAQFDMK